MDLIHILVLEDVELSLADAIEECLDDARGVLLGRGEILQRGILVIDQRATLIAAAERAEDARSCRLQSR